MIRKTTQPLLAAGSEVRASWLQQDCWLTPDGVVPIEKGKQHRDYFVPDGANPSKEYGFDLGHVRVATLGTNGSTLHFEFNERNSRTSRLIVDAIEQSRAEIITLEFHVPSYALRSNLSKQEAVSLLSQGAPDGDHLDLVFENHLSLFLIRPVSATGQTWLDENICGEVQTFGNAIVCEPRYVDAIFHGAAADGLVCR